MVDLQESNLEMWEYYSQYVLCILHTDWLPCPPLIAMAIGMTSNSKFRHSGNWSNVTLDPDVFGHDEDLRWVISLSPFLIIKLIFFESLPLVMKPACCHLPGNVQKHDALKLQLLDLGSQVGAVALREKETDIKRINSLFVWSSFLCSDLTVSDFSHLKQLSDNIHKDINISSFVC